MKDVIQKEEVDKMNHYGKIYTIMLIVTVVSTVPLFMWLGFWVLIPWGIIWMISMYFASKSQLPVVKTTSLQAHYKRTTTYLNTVLLAYNIYKQRFTN